MQTTKAKQTKNTNTDENYCNTKATLSNCFDCNYQ